MTDDQTMLYSLAANCGLREEDQQPATMNVGTTSEPRIVSSLEAWRSYYARTLVEKFDGDIARLSAARAWAQQSRSTAPKSRPGSNVFGQHEWDCAIDLCDRGMAIVRDAGAEHNEFARRRLVAGLSHTLTVETFGLAPSEGEGLTGELREIDEDERRSR